MAKKEQVLIYFRAYNKGRPQYYGMIKFLLDRRVDIIISTTAGDKSPMTIKFGGGNAKSEDDCKNYLLAFVHSGANGRPYDEQYRKCKPIVDKIWDAAVEIYGFPVLEMPTLRPGEPQEGARTAMAGIWTPGEPVRPAQ